jgi:hypothetical protein
MIKNCQLLYFLDPTIITKNIESSFLIVNKGNEAILPYSPEVHEVNIEKEGKNFDFGNRLSSLGRYQQNERKREL